MKTIEEKIEELKAKHKFDILEARFEDKINKMFPNMKVMAYMREWKGITYTVHVNIKNGEEFLHVLSKLKPTEKSISIGTAGNGDRVLNTPFRMDLNNPAVSNSCSCHEMKVSYKSKLIDVNVNIPINLVESFIRRSSRNITDSEGVHFIGMCNSEMRKHKVMTYEFTSTAKMTWYGGNQTLLDPVEIKEIIEAIKTFK
jgi:hypothetical protein